MGDVEIEHLFSNNLFLKSSSNLSLSLLKVSDLGGNELCSFSGASILNSTGLVGHWTFDELSYNGSHYIVEDLSGNGNDGTLIDNNISNLDSNTPPQLIQSNNGNALHFDGIDDVVEVVSSSELNFNHSDDFSISLAFIPEKKFLKNNDKSVTLMEYWGGAGPYPYAIRYFNSRNSIRFTRYDLIPGYPLMEPKNQVLTDSINHIAISKESNDLHFYLNGELVLSAEDTTSASTVSISNLYFGRRASVFDTYYQGSIDDIKIFNRSLNSQRTSGIILGNG